VAVIRVELLENGETEKVKINGKSALQPSLQTEFYNNPGLS